MYVRQRLSRDDILWGNSPPFLTSNLCKSQATNRSHKSCSRAVMSFKQMRILFANPACGFVETALCEQGWLVLDFGAGFIAVTSENSVPPAEWVLCNQRKVAQFCVFGVDAFKCAILPVTIALREILFG